MNSVSLLRFVVDSGSDGGRMGNLRAILIGVLIAAPVSIGRAENPTPQANAQTASTFSESDDGFRAQLNAVVQAHRSGDAAAGERLLQQFRLPDSEAWFAQNFDAGEAAKLAERYDRLFSKYAGSLEKTIQDVCKTEGSGLVVRHKDEPREPTRIRQVYKLSAVRPLRELSLARFGFAIQLKGKDVGSWEETFVYEKGAFRFIGVGAWPFWNWEEGAGPGVFEKGHFIQPLALIHQVSPEYPLAAKVQHIEGVVVLRAIVDREGKVKKVDVVQGHPLLVDAAMEAVLQSRYKPATLGGNPIEAETTISLVFQLPRR